MSATADDDDDDDDDDDYYMERAEREEKSWLSVWIKAEKDGEFRFKMLAGCLDI